MRCKDGAHEAFFLQFKHDGFLLDMVADGSKEQTLGNSKRKCKDADCLLNHIEPHLPWTNTAEAGMRELKHGSYWKMIKSQIPKKLQDYFLGLESHIRYCTVNDVYLCDNECPDTIMKRSQVDISKICEFG